MKSSSEAQSLVPVQDMGSHDLDAKSGGAGKINYSALEQHRTRILQDQLKSKLRRREVGHEMSLRRTILRLVVDAEYQEAQDTIDGYLESKSAYVALVERCRPHAEHSKELVGAIRAKRNFPGLSGLSITKQKEILDGALEHFEELKLTLKNIERMVKDEALKDMRTSVYVLHTAVIVFVAIGITALFLEFIRGGLGTLMWSVFSQLAEDGYTRLAKAIGLI